ncbi:DUF2934 domain-containing protein [Azospirillum sp. ST 5-10]|uniref:DUF2934 domain-containing protein n=1 Tax=unclassified Azospirillum TaxID=2630922 RepID=UPI003F4A5AEB
MNDDTALESRIRARAYELWDREGRPEYRHLDHWEQARREVEAEDAAARATAPAPGPSAGVQTPANVVERNLREAAERLKAAAAAEPRRTAAPPLTQD